MSRAASVASAGAGALALWAGRRVAEQRRLRLERLARRPDGVGLIAKDVTIDAIDGTPLHGWWVAGRPGSPGVIVVHGYASHAGDLLGVAPALVAAGMSVLLLDVRGHGRSPWDGRPTPPTFSQDLASALDWIEARGDVGAVALLGHSMGGSAAIRTASEREDVRAIVAVAAVADPTLTAIGGWPAGLNRVLLDRVARRTGVDPSATFARNLIGRLDIPIMLIHGEADRVVPVAHQRVLAKAQPAARVLTLPDANHSDLDRFTEAFPAVVTFLQASLVTAAN